MRRYHHSPSIPFLIIGSEAAGSSRSGLNTSRATHVAETPQTASSGQKNGSTVFIASLALGGFLAGAGIAVEIAGFREVGQALYAAGFALCAVAIVRHPKES
jgi:hypothetical protein